MLAARWRCLCIRLNATLKRDDTFADDTGESLSAVARLDTMVTVVDAYNFLKDYGSTDSIQSRGESLGEEDKRSVVDLLIDQIEFCDVLILDKVDLISDQEREKLTEILVSLNPQAKIIVSQFGQVPLEDVLSTGLFDFDKAAQSPGVKRTSELRSHKLLGVLAQITLHKHT